MNDDENIVQSRWRNRECPIYNGLLFGDGSRRPVELTRQRVPDGNRTTVRVGNIEWDKSWFFEIGDRWAALIAHCELPLGGGAMAECGEGSFGGDGYVSITDSEGNLSWLLFLDDSNPFVRLEQRGKHLVAISSLSEIWDIPIDSPESIRISSTDRFSK